MRILIVDDHSEVRKAIRALLSISKHVTCGEAKDGQEGIDKITDLKPDVVLMDVTMPRLNGLEATRRITSSPQEAIVIIVSQHESTELVEEAKSAGARGYVAKSSLAKDLPLALRAVQRGKDFFPQPD